MTDETAISIFRACYWLLRTMYEDEPPSKALNFNAGFIMGRMQKAMDDYSTETNKPRPSLP